MNSDKYIWAIFGGIGSTHFVARAKTKNRIPFSNFLTKEQLDHMEFIVEEVEEHWKNPEKTQWLYNIVTNEL